MHQLATQYSGYSLLVGLFALFLGSSAAAETIAIRNALLVDRDGNSDVTVNLLIRDETLEVITQDLLPLSDVDITYDAEGSVLLGQMVPGKPASFLILSGDPRKNVEILLDTKRYTRFAIHKGRVLRNSFAQVTTQTPQEQERENLGWLAYQPPPLALPIDYFVGDKWNKFETKAVNGLFAGALALDHQSWIDQDSASKNQVGDLQAFDGGDIRALRFGLVGTINFARPWVYTIFGATNSFDKGFDAREDDDLSLYDLRLDIPLSASARLSVGKQKEPMSMERLMSLVDSPFQERAAVSDALMPGRNVGIMVADTFAQQRVTLAGGVFNNWLDRNQPNSPSDNNTVYVGRATWLPYLSGNESTLLHLGTAIRYSDGKELVRARSRPETISAPVFVDSGFVDTESFTTYQAEASMRSGPFWLHSEFTRIDSDAPTLNDPSFEGYFLTASWFVTGEMRPYRKPSGTFGRAPVARDVNHSGWGAWELTARASHLDLSDQQVQGGEMDILSTGVNWWLTPRLSLGVNYRYIMLDNLEQDGDSHSISARLGIFLE